MSSPINIDEVKNLYLTHPDRIKSGIINSLNEQIKKSATNGNNHVMIPNNLLDWKSKMGCEIIQLYRNSGYKVEWRNYWDGDFLSTEVTHLTIIW